MKQSLHQARSLEEEAHQHEERNCREHLLLHDPECLGDHQPEDPVFHAQIAENHGEEHQGKGDREADEDGHGGAGPT